MKKLITFLAAMAMCVSLVACGGVDTQPAIDAYNTLATNYNSFVEIGNEHLDEIASEDIDFLNSVADVITEYGQKLGNGTEFTQEEVDDMVEKFNNFNDVIVEVLESLGQ